MRKTLGDDFVKITTVCCNKCNKQINTEYQSFVEIRHEFGYGTDLDGITVEIDMCEQCFIELLTECFYYPTVPRESPTYCQDQDTVDEFFLKRSEMD